MNIITKLRGAFVRRLPIPLKSVIHNFHLKYRIKIVKKDQHDFISQLRNKETINVIFLVIHDSVWKYEGIFNLLEKDPKFDVKVVVIPMVQGGEVDMSNYQQTLKYFTNSNYSAVSSYDSISNTWLDIKKLTQPDIVFFTNPHKLTFDQYYIYNFKEVLTCYVPYAFIVIHLLHLHYDMPIHHLLWKYFVETSIHREYAHSYSKRDSENVVVTGFPGLDRIFEQDYTPSIAWKEYPGEGVKRIIWAPHHTITSQGVGLDYSSFMEYSEYFVHLLKQRNDIQIAFKPHPLLKGKLYKDKNWGVEKTNEYYSQWNELPNGQLEEGAYIDLFYLSDAMILDSASFIVEYLYFDKPILFTMKDNGVKNRFNTFGQRVFDYLYSASNHDETDRFIEDIVFAGNDYLRKERNRFLEETILPGNGKTASENIYADLVRELC